jgi:hypothetical protein
LKNYRVPPTGVELDAYPLDKKGLDKARKLQNKDKINAAAAESR